MREIESSHLVRREKCVRGVCHISSSDQSTTREQRKVSDLRNRTVKNVKDLIGQLKLHYCEDVPFQNLEIERVKVVVLWTCDCLLFFFLYTKCERRRKALGILDRPLFSRADLISLVRVGYFVPFFFIWLFFFWIVI